MQNIGEYKGPVSAQKIIFWLGFVSLLFGCIFAIYNFIKEKIYTYTPDQQEALMIKYANSIREKQTRQNMPVGCVDGNCDNGDGCWTYANGAVYKGAFINSRMDGFGVFIFAPNTKNNMKFYIGNFSIGYPEGSAYIAYEDGSIYKGEVNPDYKRHGTGVLYDRTAASAKKGKWENDLLIQD